MDASPASACIEPSGSSAVTKAPRIVSGLFPVCVCLETSGKAMIVKGLVTAWNLGLKALDGLRNDLNLPFLPVACTPKLPRAHV